jgi:hypothetical protein
LLAAAVPDQEIEHLAFDPAAVSPPSRHLAIGRLRATCDGLVPSDASIGYLASKLFMLRVQCPTCGRRGRYQVARLVEEFGPAYRLTDLLRTFTADCPQKNQKGVTRACECPASRWKASGPDLPQPPDSGSGPPLSPVRFAQLMVMMSKIRMTAAPKPIHPLGI